MTVERPSPRLLLVEDDPQLVHMPTRLLIDEAA
jgi:hypothetical protein